MSDELAPRLNANPDIRGGIDEETKDSGRWRQYYTCFALCTLCLSRGLTFGWISPMIQILETDDSPVGKMNREQINYLQTIPIFPGLVGMMLTVYTFNKLGTKISSCIQAAIVTAGWVTILLATTPVALYIGRSLTSMAGLDTVSAFYLSEIAHDSRRGGLISLTSFVMSFGSLLAYFLGVVCNYKIFNLICVIPAAVFPLFIIWVPESPFQLVRFGRIDDAIVSYSWYRGISLQAAQQSVEKIRNFREETVGLTESFQKASNRKALLIMAFLGGYTQLCGVSVISSYASKIFETGHCTIAPNESAFMMAIIGFVTSFFGALLIDSAGRRFLVLTSLLVMTASMYMVATYFILEEGNWASVRSQEWLIYVGLGAYWAAITIGLWLVGPTLGSELVPTSAKGTLFLVSSTLTTILSIGTLQGYKLITDNFPYYVNFLQQAVFCSVAVIIGWFIIPETKGKSLSQITAELEGERWEPDVESDGTAEADDDYRDTARIIS